MRKPPPSTLVLALVCLVAILSTQVAAFNTFTTLLHAGEEQCFKEVLKTKDRVDLSYEITDGGNLDVDFVVFAPGNRPLQSHNAGSFFTWGFNAEEDGTYTYCFNNKRSSFADKRILFTVVGPDEKWKIEEKEMKMSLEDDPTESLQSEIRVLDAGIRAIREEHAFLKSRERRHRMTADSTNSRVLYWSLVQALALVGVVYFQINYLKRFFEMRSGRSI
ncbi:emp24/gp25L/p24 family/GOLD-domain-containing protein [Fimicolochytrium jonesii]|uniref:emp24/gp25L/p24 family/GOLD-domain-containing protein n=1 Tax=Fimicolochytrium jonesii TaxID=1396493 RepID=UPI0022FE98DD|nr:emp24/gp25L/p24 family/GOLD-domain-containing protein [Fimicolochytrium jonesii]KAI8817852.1 emp24/gp25L/p24 family/GOLD-domain-containing protein [Fimicolochytrium jonesii]